MASIEHGALVMRGSWFYAENDVQHDTMFFRATYAAAPFDRIQEAIKRFGDAVRESFGLSGLGKGESDTVMNGKHPADANGAADVVENSSKRRKISL